MKIVFLDAKTIGEDLDLKGFDELGEVVKYDFSPDEEILERVRDADVIVTNKANISEKTVSGAEKLKVVCVTATGTNNLDKPYLEKRGIIWHNVAGYSTESVAQHTFAMLFYLLEKLRYYDDYVKEERYVNDKIFTHFEKTFWQISGKTWGIAGLGEIGRRVAQIAEAFGCRVIYYSTSGKNHNRTYEEVDFDTLLAQSDILSVHAPLNEETKGIFNEAAFEKMKPEAIFLNLGRGPIVNEGDLAGALSQGKIAGAGLDVLSAEPMARDNPLRLIKDSEKLLITPHIAWAGLEARTRLMEIVLQQIKESLEKISKN
ncbi:D-2-hydroxyacid dehydrogenase [Lachnospiraceae bacterium 38-14]